jgi:hypothetical protein
MILAVATGSAGSRLRSYDVEARNSVAETLVQTTDPDVCL